MSLSGRVAVITGASSGIGASLAELLAAEGAAVALVARRDDKIRNLAARIARQGGRALAVRCDVSVSEDAEEMVHHVARELGRIDILVNNAGRGHFGAVEDTTDRIIESIFAVNVFALWYTTRPALGYMRKQGQGHIITVASLAGKLGFPYNSAYVAAKHAAVGFTSALRLELAETGIHATVVCPGSVLTEWATVTEGGNMMELFAASGRIIKQISIERSIPLPQIEGLKNPGDIARSILACIHAPVPEVYTHSGSQEFVELAARDRSRAEWHQLPVVLGERSVYDELRKKQS